MVVLHHQIWVAWCRRSSGSGGSDMFPWGKGAENRAKETPMRLGLGTATPVDQEQS